MQVQTLQQKKFLRKRVKKTFFAKAASFKGHFHYDYDLLQACHLVRIQDYIKIFHLILVPSSCYLLLYEKNFIEKAHFTK